MRVAMVIDRIEPYYRGGYERRAWELARRIARTHEVTVFTSAPATTTVDGVRIERVRPQVDYFKPDGFRDLRANLVFSAALVGEVMQHRRFDVVDCNATPFLHIYPAALLSSRARAALLVTAHEALAATMDGYFQRRTRLLPGLAARAAKAVYYRTQRLPLRLIAASSVTADELRQEGFDDVDVCAGGVAEVHAPKTWRSGSSIFVGRLVPNKRVDVVLRAFAAARPRGAATTLTIVGGGPERGSLERLSCRLGVDDAVTFAGEVSDAAKLELLLAADVFVSASVREGIAIAVLEALAAGTPAIVSHRPGVTQNGALEYIRDGCNGLVADGDAASLAAALHEIHSDPSRYAEMSRHAVASVRPYRWDAVAEGLVTIYRAAAAARAA